MAPAPKQESCRPQPSRGAFTLIELLIVIAIIAVLATVVILTLNPAELMRKSRDANRLSDLANLDEALTLYAEDQGSFPLATPGVTYLSLPDPTATTTAGTDCAGLGGYFAGGNFHCAASSTYLKVDGTGWLPVDFQDESFSSPFGKLPVDPINASSSGLYYAFQTNGTTFRLWAVPESATYLAQAGTNPAMFMAGNNLNYDGGPSWVLVPGNSTFGTNNFWVMKYDAVCSDGNGNYLNDYNSGYDTYSNSSEPCTSANGRQIASLAGGWPIANIDHTDAVSYCASIGAHLLTNDEYMTIVTNAANQGADWSGGSVGSGQMSVGNDASSGAQPEGVGAYGTGYSDFAHLRTVTLSNGSVIWDMAGNVWEHVERSVMNEGDLTTTMALPACSNATAGWESCEYGGAGTVNNSVYISAWSSDVAEADVGPPNSSWNSTNGMGQVYTYGTGANQGTNGFHRGGSWGYGSFNGPFALMLNWDAGNTNYAVGFRCAR